MSPEERIAAYDEAANVLNNYVAQEAAKIGNSQASLGLMAERVARPSGMTSGLANYTYNRTLRPTVDSLAATLTTTGRSQGLEKQLNDALMAAKNRYEDAKNRYTVASTTPRTTNPSGTNPTFTEAQGIVDATGTQNAFIEKGTILGVGTSGNGVYTVTVADGNGGNNNYQFKADSPEKARNMYIVAHGRESEVGKNALSNLIQGTQYDQPMIRRMLGL